MNTNAFSRAASRRRPTSAPYMAPKSWPDVEQSVTRRRRAATPACPAPAATPSPARSSGRDRSRDRGSETRSGSDHIVSTRSEITPSAASAMASGQKLLAAGRRVRRLVPVHEEHGGMRSGIRLRWRHQVRGPPAPRQRLVGQVGDRGGAARLGRAGNPGLPARRPVVRKHVCRDLPPAGPAPPASAVHTHAVTSLFMVWSPALIPRLRTAESIADNDSGHGAHRRQVRVRPPRRPAESVPPGRAAVGSPLPHSRPALLRARSRTGGATADPPVHGGACRLRLEDAACRSAGHARHAGVEGHSARSPAGRRAVLRAAAADGRVLRILDDARARTTSISGCWRSCSTST